MKKVFLTIITFFNYFENGFVPKEIIHQHNISEQTFCRWKPFHLTTAHY